MTTICIELPDATASAAHDAGLLTPQAIERLLVEAMDRRRRLGEPPTVPPPVESEECSARLKAARLERRRREGGH